MTGQSRSLPPCPELRPGEVWLVGAGPGDPRLLTLMAMHAIGAADVIVHDALVDTRVLALAREDAMIRFVGKRGGRPSARQADINASLVALARAGHRVVRLKGGDPYVFGRGGEEAAALAEAGVPFRVVPGITAGLAAPALAGIPTTTRRTNHAVILATGHIAAQAPEICRHWAALAQTGQPIVLYMAMAKLDGILASLRAGGLDAQTPVAIICEASTRSQRVLETDLEQAGSAVRDHDIGSPAIVIIGRNVALRQSLLGCLVDD